jgi:LmbE family N-acetylglucosaminyl deacetylase
MLGVHLANDPDTPLRVLCLGAHADDIEIGCGGTVLALVAACPQAIFYWVVFSAAADREREARHSASLFLSPTCRHQVVVKQFRDGFFPYAGAEIKEYFEELKHRVSPDVIFTHHRGDRHQDHRVVSDLTWNTFRDHLIFEYEIPKYDGDLGSPNWYVPLDDTVCRRKTEYLTAVFKSQLGKQWFSADTFRGLMRLRGIEAAAPAGYAEAFYAHKLILSHNHDDRLSTAPARE